MTLVYVPELKEYRMVTPWGIKKLTAGEGYQLATTEGGMDAVVIPAALWTKITAGSPPST